MGFVRHYASNYGNLIRLWSFLLIKVFFCIIPVLITAYLENSFLNSDCPWPCCVDLHASTIELFPLNPYPNQGLGVNTIQDILAFVSLQVRIFFL